MKEGMVTRKMRTDSRGYVRKTKRRNKVERTQTPRLRAPVRTPGETGVGIPDGRKPEAGDGAGGVTGKPVAESGRKRHRKTCERNCVKSGYWSEYVMQAGKEGFVGDAC